MFFPESISDAWVLVVITLPRGERDRRAGRARKEGRKEGRDEGGCTVKRGNSLGELCWRERDRSAGRRCKKLSGRWVNSLGRTLLGGSGNKKCRDSFYTEELYAELLSHREACTQGGLYTQKLFHWKTFTQRSSYTQKLLHTEAVSLTQKKTIQELLHTDAFTQNYTEYLLHRGSFKQRSFDRSLYT